jgi:hypothetical protein
VPSRCKVGGAVRCAGLSGAQAGETGPAPAGTQPGDSGSAPGIGEGGSAPETKAGWAGNHAGLTPNLITECQTGKQPVAVPGEPV